MPHAGRPSPDPEEQALVDRLTEAVAAAYVARTPDVRALDEPVLGVVLSVYWDGSDAGDWGPPAYAIPERAPSWDDYDGTAIDLGSVKAYADPALREPGEALLALIEAREAWSLRDAAFAALTARLAAAWGVPVAWHDFEDGIADEPADQIRAQLGGEASAEWEARGWLPPAEPSTGASPEDAVLTLPLPDGTAAGVAANGALTADLRRPWGPIVDARVATTGDEHVTIAGGRLPKGAVRARVQDLHDAWHDATVAGEVWACALPHGARGGTPPVVFADAAGAEVALPDVEAGDQSEWTITVGPAEEDDAAAFDLDAYAAEQAGWDARVLRGARVPVLWDDALGADPDLGSVGGDEDAASSIELTAGTTSVEVSDGGEWAIDDVEREARDQLEQKLTFRVGARPAGRAALEAVAQPLAGSIDGADQTFLLLAGGDVWVAVWADPRTKLDVRVQGTGGPPARLDLRRRRPPAV